MRISDWSSDVCSSDLTDLVITLSTYDIIRIADWTDGKFRIDNLVYRDSAGTHVLNSAEMLGLFSTQAADSIDFVVSYNINLAVDIDGKGGNEIGRASCRERVCQEG